MAFIFSLWLLAAAGRKSVNGIFHFQWNFKSIHFAVTAVSLAGAVAVVIAVAMAVLLSFSHLAARGCKSVNGFFLFSTVIL